MKKVRNYDVSQVWSTAANGMDLFNN